ncbi:hypothetical protein [Spirosoma luteum]|uniref:hypothetical protein n=1 Tax=Spirosoma luteum TaxID=431553 RepID=UPI00035C4D9B|nr:hypothetical protein [Spirosoma luteum]
MEPSTIQELDEWMTAHCYPDSYAIGSRNIHEGYGLSTEENGYAWFYTERGKQYTIQHFETESQAVAFAFGKITSDKTANRHLIGFLNDNALEQELLTELKTREIAWWKDEIPYGGLHDKRSRIFVFGCDIRRVPDLLEKYGTWQKRN